MMGASEVERRYRCDGKLISIRVLGFDTSELVMFADSCGVTFEYTGEWPLTLGGPVLLAALAEITARATECASEGGGE
jgi:hypothetical protein